MTLIPSSGRLVMMGSLRVKDFWWLFLLDADRVEVGEVAAFGAIGGVDDAVDESGSSRHERAGKGDGELGRGGYLVALAAECLDQAVMARAQHQGGRGRIGGYGVDCVAAVHPAVVEDDDDDGQPVAADGFPF